MAKLDELLSQFPDEIRKLLEERELSSASSDDMMGYEDEDDTDDASLGLPAVMGAVAKKTAKKTAKKVSKKAKPIEELTSKISPAAESAMEGAKISDGLTGKISPSAEKIAESAKETLNSSSPRIDRLKYFRDLLNKGRNVVDESGQFIKKGYESTIKPMASSIEKAAGKVADSKIGKLAGGAAGKTVGGLAGGYFALSDAEKALEELRRGKYFDAAADASTALGAAGLAIPHPYAKIAGAGAMALGLGMKGGLSVSEDSESEEESDLVNREKAYEAEKAFKEKYGEDSESSPSPTPSPSEVPELQSSPEPTPEPTPEPSPTPRLPLTAPMDVSYRNKMMDILGMPSAYAEDAEKVAPKPEIKKEEPAKPKVVNKDKNYYKNFAVKEALKFGVHPVLPLSVIPVESNWKLKSSLESDKGALGTMQVMPDTVADLVRRYKNFKFDNDQQKRDFSNHILKLRQKIDFNPFLKISDTIYAKRKAKQPITPEEQNLFNEESKNLSDQLKMLSPEDNIKTGISIFKMKANDYNLNSKNPFVQSIPGTIPGTKIEQKDLHRLIRAYNGAGPKTFEYLSDVMPHISVAIKDMEKFQKEKNSIGLPFDIAEAAQAEPVQTEVSAPPISESPSTSEQPSAPEDAGQTPNLPSLDLEDDEDEIERDARERLLKIIKLGNERAQEKSNREIQNIENYLKSGGQAQMLKGLALMASGIVGAGPRQKFITIPELKGVEGFDDIVKQSEREIAASKLLEDVEKRNPASLGSLLAQQNYISAMQRLHGEPLSKEELDAVKSMSEEQVEKRLEFEKDILKAQSDFLTKEKTADLKVFKAADSAIKNRIDPYIDRLEGAKNVEAAIQKIESGKIVGSKNISNLLTTELGQLFMPKNLRLGVTAQEKMAISSLETTFENVRNYLGSGDFWKLNTTIPDAYLKQMKQELQLFKERYSDILKNQSSALKDQFDALPNKRLSDIAKTSIDARTNPYIKMLEEPAQLPVGTKKWKDKSRTKKLEKFKEGDDFDISNWREVD